MIRPQSDSLLQTLDGDSLDSLSPDQQERLALILEDCPLKSKGTPNPTEYPFSVPDKVLFEPQKYSKPHIPVGQLSKGPAGEASSIGVLCHLPNAAVA